MSAFFCLVLNIFLIFISYYIYGSVFSPTFLLNSTWGIVNLFNFLLGWESNELEYLILCLPPVMFTIGALFTKAIDSKKRLSNDNLGSCSTDTPARFHIKWSFVQIFLVIETCLFLYFIFITATKISAYYSGNLWLTLRRIIWLEGTTDEFIIKYPSLVVYLFPSLLLMSYRCTLQKRYIKVFLYSLAIAIVWSLMSTSRTETFTMLVITFAPQLLYGIKNSREKTNFFLNKKIRKYIVSAAIFMVVIFCVVAFNKNGNAYGEVSTSSFIVKTISNYSNLSSACFVKWYQGGYVSTNGDSTFRFVYAVLSRLGLDVDVANTTSGGLHLQYQGMSSNAFTVARNYIQDYGIVFMAVMLLIFGIIQGILYNKAVNYTGRKKIKYCIFCGALYVPLLYQILTDQYMNCFSQWLQYYLWISLFTSKYFLTDETEPQEKLYTRTGGRINVKSSN